MARSNPVGSSVLLPPQPSNCRQILARLVLVEAAGSASGIYVNFKPRVHAGPLRCLAFHVRADRMADPLVRSMKADGSKVKRSAGHGAPARVSASMVPPATRTGKRSSSDDPIRLKLCANMQKPNLSQQAMLSRDLVSYVGKKSKTNHVRS